MFEIPDFDININDFVDIPRSTGNRSLDLFLGLAPSRLNQPILTIGGITLPLKSCKIEPSLEIKEQDMSGQTSSTATAEQGNKGKVLNISGIIPFNDPFTLKNLFDLADKKTVTTKTIVDKGKYGLGKGTSKTKTIINREVYIIGTEIAKLLKIRRVRFSGSVNATQANGLQAWQVSFQVREVISPNEVLEVQTIKQNSSPLLEAIAIPKGLVQSVDNAQDNLDTLLDDIHKQIQDKFK